MTEIVWLLTLVGCMFGLGWLLVRWMTARGAAEYRQEETRLRGISSLSLQQAKSSALPHLSDPSLFRCVESPIDDDGSLAALAPELRGLLLRYAVIETAQGAQASIVRSSIGPSHRAVGFLRIGSVAGSTDVAGDLGVRPGDERIYELYTAEAPDPTFGTHRSVYHWLLTLHP